MKDIASVFVAAAIMAIPLVASADQTTLGQPNAAAMTIMQQAHAKMEQLHSQARLSMLNSLTPAHRTLLANVVGQLAISASPDAAAAARQLDAGLSSGESRAVLNVSASFEQQARQIMEAARQQLQASGVGPPSGMHAMDRGPEGMRGTAEAQESSDAGTVLLGMAAKAIAPNHGWGMAAAGMRHSF